MSKWIVESSQVAVSGGVVNERKKRGFLCVLMCRLSFNFGGSCNGGYVLSNARCKSISF